MIRKTILSMLLAAPLMASSAMALTATQTVEREITVQNADGTQTIQREKAVLVTPGDKVVYSLNYYNDKDAAAENIVLSMPIPSEVSYVEGSADASGARVSYSTDGGRTYTERDTLTVLENGDTRAARSEDITNIKWKLGEAIAPQQAGSLSYSGRLK